MNIDINTAKMTRTISGSVSGILGELELENETYVNISRIEELAQKYNVKSKAPMIAKRLRESGWLIPTSQRGVWEFAPASMSGAFSRNDPLREIKAYMIANPNDNCYLCLQTAAWALGLSDRLPGIKELAFEKRVKNHISPQILRFIYAPRIQPQKIRGVECLVPESIVVHMATKPDIIKDWNGVLEWLPDIVYETDVEKIVYELDGRNDSVIRRTGYLLQGMYPDAAEAIYKMANGRGKIRFGAREKSIRNDEKWMISDTILPVSPQNMERVK